MPVRDSDGMPATIGGGGQRTIFVPWGCERIKNGKAHGLPARRGGPAQAGINAVLWLPAFRDTEKPVG